MAQFVPAGIRLVAIGVSSFQQSMSVANQARQQFTSGLEQANVGRFNSELRDTATAAVATAVGIGLMTTALAEFIASASGFASVKFAAEVERDAKFMQAVLQATDQDMKQLLGTAETLGANVPVAFRDIISQIRELGRAGIGIDAITESAAKLTVALSILARGEASPQKIAESLSAGAASFTRGGENPADQLDEVAQALLGVANATRLSIPEVINAFSKSAPQAGLFKATAEELGAFIALVGAAGIRGEEAGTGIRNFLLRLANPSKEAAEQMEKFGISAFDATGKTRPLVDIIGNLQQVFSDEAIALSGITEAQRAYALSQIFQTRTAAVAALAIARGTEEYDRYLAVIRETNPLQQAAVATDNLLDRIGVFINRVRILGNTFGQAVLPGLTKFAASINNIIGDVSQPTNTFRQAAGALGAGVSSLFSGEGVGAAADQLEAQFGSTVANLFESVAEQAGRVRDVILRELVPAIGQFFQSLGRLSSTTIFDTGAVTSFGDAIVVVIGRFSQLIRIGAGVVEAIDTIRPSAVAMATGIGQAIANVVSLIGHLINGLLLTMRDLADPLVAIGDKLDFAKAFAGQPTALGALGSIAKAASDVGNAFGTASTFGQQLQLTFAGIEASVQEANEKLQQTMQTERNIRGLAQITRVWEQELRRLQEIQLSEEGPDVSEQIDNTQLIIDGLREQIRVQSGVADATEAETAVSKAAAEAKAAYDKTVRDLTTSFDNLGAKEQEERRQQQEIATSTRRLAEIYDDLGRSAARAVRELGDRVDDLVTKTNRALQKLSQDTADRINDVRRNLDIASRDAREAFDFETSVRNQRVGVTQMFEDINTALSRSFDVQRRGLSDSIEDRERVRQREVQLVNDALQRQVDDNVRANSEINEDYQQSLSRRNEDLQRALSRAHQLQTEQLQATFDAQNQARSRTNEDAARERQLARDLAKAKTDEERRSIRERFQEETTTIGERRTLETNEANIRKQQEQQLKDLRVRQENETLNVTRSLAKQELDIRRQLAREERDFRLQQEFALAAARILIEEQVIRESRRLRETVDIPAQQRLEDRQTGARRQIGTAEQGFEDFFRVQNFFREQFLRERAADRQEEEIVRNAAKREIEILEGFDEEGIRIIREFLQKMADQQGQAMNTAADILKRVGVDFPALQQFRGNVPGLFGSATGAGQGITGDLRSRLSVPTLPTPGGNVGSQVPPEIIQLALIPAAALSARFGDLTLALTALTTAIQQKATLGGVNVTVDDINLGNSIIIGADQPARIGGLIGSGLARAVAPIGGQ